MRQSRFTKEQVIAVLREHDATGAGQVDHLPAELNGPLHKGADQRARPAANRGVITGGIRKWMGSFHRNLTRGEVDG